MPDPSSLYAAIHIGASSISLLILQQDDKGELQPGDFLEQTLPLARDIFRKAKVSRSTTQRAVTTLKGYQKTLQELGIDPSIRAVATNVLNEASNQDAFLNRIQIACGLSVETLDEGEMTRLIYLKTRRRLRDTPSMQHRNTLVLHVGPGNTRALLFKKGKIASYTSYRLGVYRTLEDLASQGIPEDNSSLLDHIRSPLSQIEEDYSQSSIKDIILIGYEIQTLFYSVSEEQKTQFTSLELEALCLKIASMSEEERVANYHLDYQTARAILPALLINLTIAQSLGVKTLRTTGSDYEKGLLQDIPHIAGLTQAFRHEVLRSARLLAKKYTVDFKHASQVALLSQSLFRQTESLHQLDNRDALLLECAAYLHDCGHFISPRAHHKHSYYIISHSEIFGLRQSEVDIVALIARYHRRSEPKASHAYYHNLPLPKRIRIAKLAALLRIADALDAGHRSRVRSLDVSILPQEISLTLHGINDAFVERLALRSKSSFFENIFGLKVTVQENTNSQ